MANKRQIATEQVDNQPRRISYLRPRQSWLVPGLLALIAALLIISLVRNWDNPKRQFHTKNNIPALARREQKRRLAGLGQLSQKGNHIVGVVMSVNGSSFTVAGNGSSTNVTTNSSTRYRGGAASDIKANDSVAVRGTNNNGTLTATKVVINP